MNATIARERMSAVLRPDSITTSDVDFLATHVPLTRLITPSHFDSMPDANSYRSEEEVFQEVVLNPQNRHQFVVVYGQSGTGKSHLIRWFASRMHQQQPENEEILFISRKDNTLKGTIRQILGLCKSFISPEIYERLQNASAFEDEQKLKGRIYHNFINEIQNDDSEHRKYRSDLAAFLSNDIIRTLLLAEDGPIDRIFSKVAENTEVDRDTTAQFYPKDFVFRAEVGSKLEQAGADRKAASFFRKLQSEDASEYTAKAAAYLNKFVNPIIRQCTGISPGDLRDIFNSIRHELYMQGKNLTIFIEDVTSFTGVDDTLLDALIVEHTGVNAEEELCRISSIVGTTSSFLSNNFRDNHKDRITQYVYIPSDAFSEQEVCEFVGRYINTMSLPVETLGDWVNNGAKPADYPVHTVTEGAKWDFFDLPNGTSLCLYPFTQRSIRNLCKLNLNNGQETPRYIIRDIIEPAVNNILFSKTTFPSFAIQKQSFDPVLTARIRSQFSDKETADRLLRLLSIWGTGEISRFEQNGETYVSALNTSLLQELSLPIPNFEVTKTPQKPQDSPENLSRSDGDETKKEPAAVIPAASLAKQSNAAEELAKWENGNSIDISSTGGTSGIIRQARLDLANFVLLTINWLSEGFSQDEREKIGNQSSSLIALENQTKSSGIYILPATFESGQVLMAFFRWREFGKQSWNYPASDVDVYAVTAWLAKNRGNITESVRSHCKVSYIEVAIVCEAYCQQLFGEGTGAAYKFSMEQLLTEPAQRKPDLSTQHTASWGRLKSYYTDKKRRSSIRETIRKHFNIPQGDSTSIIVLDSIAFEKTIRRIKKNGIEFYSTLSPVDDPIKERAEVYNSLAHMTDGIISVIREEKEKARKSFALIQSAFDGQTVTSELILDLVKSVGELNKAINAAGLSIATPSCQKVQKNSNAIVKAINQINKGLEAESPFEALCYFSNDPIEIIQPLNDLLTALNDLLKKVDTESEKKTQQLRSLPGMDIEETDLYKAEKEKIAGFQAVLEGMDAT